MSEFVVNEAFCLDLQVHLTTAFVHSTNDALSAFWCDGIAMPDDAQLWGKNVNATRKIITQAWIGEDGQRLYQMTILLGPKALSRYARGLDLYPCLPDVDTDGWININIENAKIELQFEIISFSKLLRKNKI